MNEYTEKPVLGLILKMLPASCVSLLISSVASLIDTIVVSHFMGPVALSAVNICMPIYSILTALVMLIVGGASTLYSNYLGKNDKDKAVKVYSLSFIVTMIFAVIYTLIGIFFLDGFVRFLGANDVVFEMSRDYARVLFYFVIIVSFFSLAQVFVKIDFDPILNVIAIVVCAVVNFILDVLLIGPYINPNGFGTTGAAFATCIAYTIAAAIMFIHFLKKKNNLKIVKNCFSFSELVSIFKIGLPGAITLIGTAITMTVFNNFIIVEGTKYGRGIGELYVSVYSVIVQVMTISMALYAGIGQSCIPVFSANFGAGKKDRVKDTFIKGLILEVVLNAVLMVVFFIQAENIAGFFSMNKGAIDMTDVCIFAIKVFSLSLIITSINHIIMCLLQSTGIVLHATLISFLSGTVLLIVGLYVLAGIIFKGNEFGVGIWGSYIFAQAITLIYAIIIYVKKKKYIF